MFSNTKLLKRVVYHVTLPLTAGLIVYLLLRKPVTNLHQWLGISNNLSGLKSGSFGNFILYQLPDMLWAYSLCAALLILTSFRPWVCATIAITMLSFIEYWQAGWVVKKVDWIDVSVMTIAVLLAILKIKR